MTEALAGEDIRARMERMYRPQRHVYDLTRRYYLIGRDRLIAGMAALPGQTVLEIGCGTGRNLAAIARRYPEVRLFGLDASRSMLDQAAAAARRQGWRVELTHGVAEDADAPRLLGDFRGFDHIVFSYCLSMVDAPLTATQRALNALEPGGTLHIVDFGGMGELPDWTGRAMGAWLARFGVRHRPEVETQLARAAGAGRGHLEVARLGRGYATLIRFRKVP